MNISHSSPFPSAEQENLPSERNGAASGTAGREPPFSQNIPVCRIYFQNFIEAHSPLIGTAE